MVMTSMCHLTDPASDRPTTERPVPGVVPPDRPAVVGDVLRSGAMVAVPLEPGEHLNGAWVERMRVPFTNQARHLVERALSARAAGPPTADRKRADDMPTWALEAAACHRGLLDALGVDLTVGVDVPAGPGEPVLIQHLVPAITLGSYIVTTVYASMDEVLMIEGVYGAHHADEAPFPVRWARAAGTTP